MPKVLTSTGWLLVSLGVFMLDQVTKYYAVNLLPPYSLVKLTSFLGFTLSQNNGAAFSLLTDAGGWQRWFFIVISSLVSLLLIFWLYKWPRKNIWLPLALTLILGGAIGNLWDRIHLGYVIDFILFHIGTWHFPVFNVADSAITIGAMILIITTYIFNDEKTEE